jgi:hypothetical protein
MCGVPLASWTTEGIAMRRLLAFYRLRLKGIWIAPVCLLISCLAVAGGPIRVFVGHVLGVPVPQHGDSSISYLHNYVADGVSAFAALFLILVLVFLTARRSPQWAITFGLFPSSAILMPVIAYAAAILWRSLKLLDPKQAESLLRDDDLAVRTHEAGAWSAFAVMALLSIVWGLMCWFRKTRTDGAGRASTPVSVP